MFLEYINAVLNWCRIKISLWEKSSRILFKEGEIWWCRVGMNVGVEIYGKGSSFTRPILVLKKLNAEFFVGIPLTSKKKEGSWFAPVIYNEKEGRAVLSQVRAFDGRRLVSRIGILSEVHFETVRVAFHDLMCR
jgi:mRNA interferase MazF